MTEKPWQQVGSPTPNLPLIGDHVEVKGFSTSAGLTFRDDVWHWLDFLVDFDDDNKIVVVTAADEWRAKP
jgi:hypothetical protein